MQNLSSGFHDFINEAEMSYVSEINQKLEIFYQQHGDWSILKNDEQRWRRLVGVEGEVNDKPDSRSLSQPSDPTGLSKLLQTQRRLSLYDVNQNVVVGLEKMSDNAFSQTIQVDGVVVGWLSFIPSQLAEQSPANDFLTQQYFSYSLIMIAVIFIAFMTAWLFSRLLVAPITTINQETTRLIRGDYSARIKSSTHDELSQLSESMNVLAETLQKNKTERSKWMSDVAHELKTPLTVVRGQLTAIQDGIFQPDEQRLQVMMDQIDSMSYLVGDIYQLSITDIGGLSYRKSLLNPIEIFVDIAHGFEAKAKLRGLVIESSQINSSSLLNPCTVLADKDRMIQLFNNLFENSFRYTDAPGCIRLSAEVNSSARKVIIMIEDSSPSIPKQDFSRVFDRFYRVEQSRNREYGGSGIGLALCQQIVDAHQGTIHVESSNLGGVKMVVSFPIYRGEI
ncbi:ATP-binding protein [Vibrio gallicus]|uniref:ATP-binding protein n=1 Tax=Vibrio gallicus TaxID=190897 RepID=UPI0021C3782E|nr:ATP-binding protein [Vibrio gallicus]